MNTSRFVLTQIVGRTNGQTFTYHGKGYTYHLHKTAKDIWAKLQIARKTMQAFLKATGMDPDAKRTIHGLNGLSVCDQGVGGWYEVFVIDEQKLFAVLNFIKKLNKFMNRTLAAHVRKGHYFIEARRFEHAPPRHVQQSRPPQPNNVVRPIAFQSVLQPKPVQHVAPAARLQMLAATVNSRYGH